MATAALLLSCLFFVCCSAYYEESPSEYALEPFFSRSPRWIFSKKSIGGGLISGRGMFRPGFSDYWSASLSEPNFSRLQKRSAIEDHIREDPLDSESAYEVQKRSRPLSALTRQRYFLVPIL